jgi:hypothetical protein
VEQQIDGNWNIVCNGTKTEYVKKAVKETYYDTQDITVTKTVTEDYKADKKETVSSTVQETYGSTQTTNVSSTCKITGSTILLN